jgi:hypothetical protein
LGAGAVRFVIADDATAVGVCDSRDVKRREQRLPDVHALRRGAAMDCDDVEEASDLPRHKDSDATSAIYRVHRGDRRRELLRARMPQPIVGISKTAYVLTTPRCLDWEV